LFGAVGRVGEPDETVADYVDVIGGVEGEAQVVVYEDFGAVGVVCINQDEAALFDEVTLGSEEDAGLVFEAAIEEVGGAAEVVACWRYGRDGPGAVNSLGEFGDLDAFVVSIGRVGGIDLVASYEDCRGRAAEVDAGFMEQGKGGGEEECEGRVGSEDGEKVRAVDLEGCDGIEGCKVGGEVGYVVWCDSLDVACSQSLLSETNGVNAHVNIIG